MDLQNISNDELVNRMQKLVRTERKITHLILTYILEIESRRIYADLGYDGVYTYLTRGLGYSEAAAYRRLQSARLLKQIPEVAEKIESGSIHLSQLTRVQKCITAAKNKGALVSTSAALNILEQLENKNSFQTEAVLAKEFNLPAINHESIRPQNDDSVRIELTLSAQQFEELETAKSLLSHICHEGNWSEVIATLAVHFNKKHQPKDQESLTTDKQNGVLAPERSTHGVIATKVARRSVPIKLKKILIAKAGSCCEFVNDRTGHRCNSRYQLQVDHIKPVALGGENSAENLRILCRTHNLFVARQLGLIGG